MPAPVYSIRIFSGHIDASVGVEGPVVPAGLVYVVRDIDVVQASSNVGDEFAVFNPTGGFMWLYKLTSANLGLPIQWRGRQIYGPGERVAIQPFVGTFDAMISGYQLTLP